MTAGAVRPSRLSAMLAAAVILGGCGGDDGAPKVQTKADFIAAGDKICVERDRRSAMLATGAGNDGDVARLTGELAGIYADAIEQQQALDLPQGAARAGALKFRASVAALRMPVQRMKAASGELAAAVQTESPSSVKTTAKRLQQNVNTVQAISDLADQNARRYGFRDCGQQQSADP